MIVDLRTYTVPTGRVGEFLSLYAAEGLPVQARHLGPPIGYYTTEVGNLGEVVHLWRYEDMADRERRRGALERDPQWLAYRAKAAAAGQVVRQTNTLLREVDFAAFTNSAALR
jgi:hypothetical protein